MNRRKLKIMGVLVVVWFLLWLPGLFFSGYTQSPLAIVVVFPFLSVYLLDNIGVPGLLDRASCSWGWCEPTAVGVLAAVVVWLLVLWLIAGLIVRLRQQGSGSD